MPTKQGMISRRDLHVFCSYIPLCIFRSTLKNFIISLNVYKRSDFLSIVSVF